MTEAYFKVMSMEPNIKYRINQDLDKNHHTDFRVKLESFFKEVHVIVVSEVIEEYRIDSSKDDAIFGKDFLVLALRREALNTLMEPGCVYRLFIGIDDLKKPSLRDRMLYRLGNQIMKEFMALFQLKKFCKKYYPQFIK